MKIFLTEEQIKKILSTFSLEDLESRLDYNWETWDVLSDSDNGISGFSLTKIDNRGVKS